MQDPAFLERLDGGRGLEAHELGRLHPGASPTSWPRSPGRSPRSPGKPSPFDHLFFIEGGAAAVENTLKVAFDWKVQKNLRRGLSESLGTRVAHFDNAFHGRSGYTLSLTNTFDPRKTRYFPKFDWPRLPRPSLSFPVDRRGAGGRRAARAASRSRRSRKRSGSHRHDVACVIIETIQGEGGDNHFRPEFLRALRDVCDEDEMLLIFDEVQCGLGITGRWWAFEHAGVCPDIFSFGKKTQTCGLAATAPLRRRRFGLQGAEPHQLDVRRQPRRHGAVRPLHRDHRARRDCSRTPRRRGARCSSRSSASPPSSRPWSPTCGAAG